MEKKMKKETTFLDTIFMVNLIILFKTILEWIKFQQFFFLILNFFLFLSKNDDEKINSNLTLI